MCGVCVWCVCDVCVWCVCVWCVCGVCGVERERNVLFNDVLNTFYLRLHGVRHMVKDHSDSEKGVCVVCVYVVCMVCVCGLCVWCVCACVVCVCVVCGCVV